MRGHSRLKNGVATLAYDPRIHHPRKRIFLIKRDGLPGQARQ
jgi:hypothetical protein